MGLLVKPTHFYCSLLYLGQNLQICMELLWGNTNPTVGIINLNVYVNHKVIGMATWKCRHPRSIGDWGHLGAHDF